MSRKSVAHSCGSSPAMTTSRMNHPTTPFERPSLPDPNPFSSSAPSREGEHAGRASRPAHDLSEASQLDSRQRHGRASAARSHVVWGEFKMETNEQSQRPAG